MDTKLIQQLNKVHRAIKKAPLLGSMNVNIAALVLTDVTATVLAHRRGQIAPAELFAWLCGPLAWLMDGFTLDSLSADELARVRDAAEALARLAPDCDRLPPEFVQEVRSMHGEHLLH